MKGIDNYDLYNEKHITRNAFKRTVSAVSGKPTSERKCTVLESCHKTGDGDHM